MVYLILLGINTRNRRGRHFPFTDYVKNVENGIFYKNYIQAYRVSMSE